MRVKAKLGLQAAHYFNRLAIRSPAIPIIAKRLAFTAYNRGDYERALRLWNRVALWRPDWSVTFAGKAGALRGLDYPDDARHLLLAGLDRFGEDFILLSELGWLLLDRNEFDEALSVWRRALVAGAGKPMAHVGLATALRQMRRFDEADTILVAAARLFPDSCLVASNYAIVSDVSGNRAEARQRWQDVLARFPQDPIGYAGLGSALKALGDFAAADAVFDEGTRRFPRDRNIAINQGWVPVAKADWPEALRRWNKLRDRWPDDPRVKREFSEVALQASLAAADQGTDLMPPASDAQAKPPGDRIDTHTLMTCFESIGENCELGFVQRHFDTEPLGLFRWAGISYSCIIDALNSDLSGIGAHEHTVLQINPNNHEYFTEDYRYGMTLHSFIIEGSSDAADVKDRLCRRTSYLRDKLIRDLQSDDKVFVFNAAAPLTDAELLRLHAALCRYATASLLHVAPHPDLPPGSVATVSERLWRGSLGQTGFNGRIWDIEFDSWLTICQTVHRLNLARIKAAA